MYAKRAVLAAAVVVALLAGGQPGAAAVKFRPAVAVLTVQNLSNHGGGLLGRRAADQLALDLGNTGAWRVLDRAQTDRACRQRELSPPYAVGYMQAVGHALGADLVAGGTVQTVTVDARAGVARLALYVEIVDQVSGQLVVGAQQKAEARRDSAKPEPTDVLVGRALAEACAKAAKLSAAGPGAQGEVTDPGDGKAVVLKLADQAVLKPGQRLLLYRAITEGEERLPGKLIAAVMVAKSDATTTEARVLARSGDIHTGDIAVTIYEAAPAAAAPR